MVVGGTYNSVDIDWRAAVEIRHFFDNSSTPGLVLIGGASTRRYNKQTEDKSETGPTQALGILTGALSMDDRLTKAVKVILDGCTDKSLGF